MSTLKLSGRSISSHSTRIMHTSAAWQTLLTGRLTQWRQREITELQCVFVPPGTHPLFQLLLSLQLPQRQSLLQRPLLGPLPGAPDWAILPSQPLEIYFSGDRLKILAGRQQYGNLKVKRRAPALRVTISQLNSKPTPPHHSHSPRLCLVLSGPST